MSISNIFRTAIVGTGLSLIGGSAIAQQAPPWNEQSGDIVVLRQVPHQNAVLVGEPGRPTLVNPRAVVVASIDAQLGASLFRPLSDQEASVVRATRTSSADLLGDPLETLVSEDVAGARFAEPQTLGNERSGFLGGAFSGAVGGATRSIQGILAGAFGRGP